MYGRCRLFAKKVLMIFLKGVKEQNSAMLHSIPHHEVSVLQKVQRTLYSILAYVNYGLNLFHRTHGGVLCIETTKTKSNTKLNEFQDFISMKKEIIQKLQSLITATSIQSWVLLNVYDFYKLM